MNRMLWGRWLGASVMASAFAVSMAGSLLGCNLLKPKKAFGESCSLATDCVSMDCAAQGNVCSKDCIYDKECGDGFVCRQKEDGPGDHCTKPVGNPPNGTCMDASDCQNAHCLKRTGQDLMPGVCSKFCTSPDDCPTGMKICDLINDTAVNKMCIPGDAAAPPTQRPVFSQPAIKKPVVPGQPAFAPRPLTTTPVVAPTPTIAAPAPTPTPTPTPTVTTPPATKPGLIIKPRTPKK